MGIISIKRTSAFPSFARRARRIYSSSSAPCKGTQFTLTLSPGNPAAASKPSQAFSTLPPLVTSRYRSGSRVSMLILTEFKLLETNSFICSFKSVPFVVSVTCSIPGILFSIPRRSGSPLRTRGSPPVSFSFVMPSSAPIRQILAISSKLRISSWGTKGTPAAGMQ